MKYTYVTDCALIDLDRHGFIEASAGTGKTHTIESLVVRLLTEKQDIELENILIVTFTEKATSELKQRIQEKLEKERVAQGNHAENSKKIKDTLDAFDTASIHTIHGFCQTVLREFAFENKSLFSSEVINDGPLLETSLKEQMRKSWPETYGDVLPDLLAVSEFSGKEERFLSLVTGLARRFRPESGDTIAPPVNEQSPPETIRSILDRVDTFKELVHPGFSETFEQLNLKKAPKDLFRSFLAEIIKSNPDIKTLTPLLSQMGLFKTPDIWLRNKPNADVCPGFTSLMEKAVALHSDCLGLIHSLTVNSLIQLKKDAVSLKDSRGWLSYDDMISRVESALYGPGCEELLRRLRMKYKAAFVDEFQDTDMAQWKIFRRIFLETPQIPLNNRLFLIGDPKQAIYAFRGADVFVYLAAKNEMVRLADEGWASLYSLATNWRSAPGLVTSFNRLFCREPWFVPGEQAGSFEIGYLESGYPDEPLRPEILVADDSRRSPLNIVDISRHTQARQVKSDLAEFITDEILYLMDRGGMEIQKKNALPRPLNHGDFCILVRGKNDLTALEPLLVRKKIPYTYYKKPGLFLSDEAFHLSLLFHGIRDPGNTVEVKKALLTPFFDIHSSGIGDYDLQPMDHPVKQLFSSWNLMSMDRKWSRLFHSLMEDSGLIFRESPAHDWDRKQTNYKQIFEHLEWTAYKKNLDFRGLSAVLDGYRNQTADVDEQGDIHQIETEDTKVQIMTMHVSKGLQFPIVFIAGGLTGANQDVYHTYHRYDSPREIRKVFDLTKTLDKEQHVREKNDEDKRLFYVALTRAQFKLYVPYFSPGKNHRLNGPVPGFISAALGEAFPKDSPEADASWLTSSVHDTLEPSPCPEARNDESLNSAILPCASLPRPGDYRARKYRMESFSTLHGRHYHKEKAEAVFSVFHTNGLKERDDDERQSLTPPPQSTPAQPQEIPGGANTGSMLHDILETIDFQNVSDDPGKLLTMDSSRELIDKTMAMYGVASCHRDSVCRIISSTLTTQVRAAEEPFTLASLKPSQRLHETEFFFPMPKKLSVPGMDSTSKGYLHGFIDMIFHKNGKFYVADWKSNRLEEGYGRTSMEKCMTESGYHLQYRIYTAATLRWLGKTLGETFDPDQHFGGVFYFFLRGMGIGDDQGIYFAPPSDVGRLDHLEHEIAQVVGL